MQFPENLSSRNRCSEIIIIIGVIGVRRVKLTDGEIFTALV